MRLHALIFLALAALFAGCSDEKSEKSVARSVVDPHRPLVFLTHPTEPPCSYVNEKGEFAGTNIELAKKIAAELGVELKIEGVEFDTIIPRLKAGTADLGIATITITEARRKDVDFSVPYEMGGVCFLYRADGVKPRMSQLASLRVGVESGTLEDLYLCHHGCDPVRFANMDDAIGAMTEKKVDAVFFDAIPLRYRAETSGGKFLVTTLETREHYGVAVSKGRPDVLAAANKVIAKGGVK